MKHSLTTILCLAVLLALKTGSAIAGNSPSNNADAVVKANDNKADAMVKMDAHYSNMPTTAVKNVAYPRPPISCKVSAKGVLIDCRINDGYDLNDVANWFQDDHDRTLQVAVNSVTLAKKLERSFESCLDKKGKK